MLSATLKDGGLNEPYIILLASTDGVCLWCNRLALRLFSYGDLSESITKHEREDRGSSFMGYEMLAVQFQLPKKSSHNANEVCFL